MSVLRITCGLVAFCAACFAGDLARAQGTAEDGPFSWFDIPANRVDYSSGGDITGTSRSTFGTVVIAPLAALDEDGWRLKLYGAQSTYSYGRDHDYCKTAIDEKRRGVKTRAPGIDLTNICSKLGDGSLTANERAQLSTSIAPYGLFVDAQDILYHQNYEVTRYDAALTPGYQFRAGTAIIKAWLGPGFEYSQTTPLDPAKTINGALWGAKGGVDAWMPLGEDVWVAADGAYFTASERYSASLRLGLKPMPWLAVGPQLAAFGDSDDNSQRAGGFVTIDALGMETTLSGGWTGNYRESPSPYGTASVYMKF